MTRKLFILASDGFIAVEICSLVVSGFSLGRANYFYSQTAVLSFGISRIVIMIAKTFWKFHFFPVIWSRREAATEEGKFVFDDDFPAVLASLRFKNTFR